MPAESLWRAALERTQQAGALGQLVPLRTEQLQMGLEPFVVRRLLNAAPRHLSAAGPRLNPFLPWEQSLEISRLPTGHGVLLNKYPVQPAHLLVITPEWQPQDGWLRLIDFEAVVEVSADTTGLWFFNSCAAAGASQPHRHLQLLPRHATEPPCPLDPLIRSVLAAGALSCDSFAWAHALSHRRDPTSAQELHGLMLEHASRLGLGDPRCCPRPLHPYNLLICDDWLLTVRRRCEHWYGFSINALGFAGYLLATQASELDQLRRQGPWQLLRTVAAEPSKPASEQGGQCFPG